MTESGFEKLVRFLEGSFQVTLDEKGRDAYWLNVAQESDGAVFQEAIAYTRDRARSRFGFPRPADLVPQRAASEPAYIVEARRFDERYRENLLPSADEAKRVVAALRSADPEPPTPAPIRLSDRLRAWRRAGKESA